MAVVHKKEVGKQTSGQNIKGENMARTAPVAIAGQLCEGYVVAIAGQLCEGYLVLPYMPCFKTKASLHAMLQNKSIICSGSQVTNCTVIKLHGSVNRGLIIVKTCTKSTCSHM